MNAEELKARTKLWIDDCRLLITPKADAPRSIDDILPLPKEFENVIDI